MLRAKERAPIPFLFFRCFTLGPTNLGSLWSLGARQFGPSLSPNLI